MAMAIADIVLELEKTFYRVSGV